MKISFAVISKVWKLVHLGFNFRKKFQVLVIFFLNLIDLKKNNHCLGKKTENRFHGFNF